MKTKNNYFKDFSVEAYNLEDNKVRITIRFEIDGKIKEDFNLEKIEEAYDKGDRKFNLNFYIKIVKRGFIFKKELIKERIKRKAIIFWTRNPLIHKRIWVELIMEDGKPYILYDFNEIKKKLFNFEREYIIDLNVFKGYEEVKLLGIISAKWSKYFFTPKDYIEYKEPIILKVV
jgi:hypothetical protein